MNDVTQILHQMELGDSATAELLLPLIYDELRQLATHRMKSERPDLTIQATALVHEAYLRLVHGGVPLRWRDRAHLVSAFSEVMRRILVENARRRTALKRGSRPTRHSLEAAEPSESPVEEMLALDDALNRLDQIDPQKAEVVRLRFFGGLTIGEIARTLGISPRTTDRHWAYARAWLLREMGPPPDPFREFDGVT